MTPLRYCKTEWDLRVIYAMISQYMESEEGREALETAQNYAMFDEGECALWVGYHGFDGVGCDVDICVGDKWRGKWINDDIKHLILSIPNREWQVDELRALVHNEKWRARLLRNGFKPAYNDPSRLVFTYTEGSGE